MKKAFCVLVIVFLFAFLGAASADSVILYFSCTGTTEKIAEWIAEETEADLYRILPEIPYTEEDLDYYSGGRADQEQEDDTARPEIANMPGSLDQYDTVFLGYPIWHGKAPKIMYTLLENVNIQGKTIVPFCTSASSPIGSSATILQGLTGDVATWLKGKRFGRTSEQSEVSAWIRDLDLPAWSKTIYITVENRTMAATLSDNASAKALYALMKQNDITVAMQDYGGFEKVGPLGTKIVQCDEEITTAPGDIILYQGDKITIYYAENTWTFTRLGHIDGATAENMKTFLGDGDPTVTFSVADPSAQLPEHRISVTTDGHGTASADPVSGPEGTEVTLTAVPDKGYAFREWKVLSGEAEVKDNRLIIGKTDVEIQAVFEKQKIDISEKGKISSIKDQVYTGKAIRPAITVKVGKTKLTSGTDYKLTWKKNKNVGTATVTVSGKGDYTGKLTATFTILPRPTVITSLKSARGRLTVNWKKSSGITGYEIAYGFDKDFRDAKTIRVIGAATVSKEIKKPEAGRMYYVRIRTYKTVRGERIYSAWSKAKHRKISGS